MTDRKWTWKAHVRGRKPDPEAATVTLTDEGSDSRGRILYAVEVDGLMTAEEIAWMGVEVAAQLGRGAGRG